MLIKKILISVIVAFTFFALPLVYVAAESPVFDPINGTIQTITPLSDPDTGEIVVRVGLRTEDGVVSLTYTLENAVALGLVTASGDTPPVVTVVETMLDQPLIVDPELVQQMGELVTQPVALLLGDFLSGTVGLDGAALMAFHDQGVGFGVLAQAGFMTIALDGDSTIFSSIMEAKKSGDYSAITLPDGATAKNWGQLRKQVFADEKNLKNLGAVVSGRADKQDRDQAQNEHGNGKDKGGKK